MNRITTNITLHKCLFCCFRCATLIITLSPSSLRLFFCLICYFVCAETTAVVTLALILYKIKFSMPGFICNLSFGRVWAILAILVSMRRNGHNSTSGQIFNPKFEIPMGCFLFEYEFWWHFRQDLYVFWTKNGFCNAKFSEFGGWWGWGWPFFDETPKRHILGRFHTFWAACGSVPTFWR